MSTFKCELSQLINCFTVSRCFANWALWYTEDQSSINKIIVLYLVSTQKKKILVWITVFRFVFFSPQFPLLKIQIIDNAFKMSTRIWLLCNSYSFYYILFLLWRPKLIYLSLCTPKPWPPFLCTHTPIPFSIACMAKFSTPSWSNLKFLQEYKNIIVRPSKTRYDQEIRIT